MRRFFLMFLLILFLLPIHVNAEISPSSLDYLSNSLPWGACVIAYDPVSPDGNPCHFDALPAEYNSGEASDLTPEFNAIAEAFSLLNFTSTADTANRDDTFWRFGISYSVKLPNETVRTIRLDFYDYSQIVDLSFADQPNTIYHGTISEESSYALEEAYINIVARLRRIG